MMRNIINNTGFFLKHILLMFSFTLLIRSFFGIGYNEFSAMFLVIYSTLPLIRFLEYIFIFGKCSLNKKFILDGLEYTTRSVTSESVIMCFTWYSSMFLFKLNIMPFFLFNWEDINYYNLSRFYIMNKNSFVKFNLIKVNFGPLLSEIRKLIPKVSINHEYYNKIIGEEIPIISDIGANPDIPAQNQAPNIINYPTNRRFNPNYAVYNPANYRLNLPLVIWENNAHVQETAIKYKFRQQFFELKRLSKAYAPIIDNNVAINSLAIIINTPFTENAHDYRIYDNIKLFMNTIIPHHTCDIKTNQEMINTGITYSRSISPFLIIKPSWKPDNAIGRVKSPWEIIIDAQKSASIDGGINKFVMILYHDSIAFFIHQQNFLRGIALINKPDPIHDLVGIYLNDKGIAVVPQSTSRQFNVMPYNIITEKTSIMTILGYISTCPDAPTLLYSPPTVEAPSGKIVIIPPVVTAETSQVFPGIKALDNNTRIGRDGAQWTSRRIWESQNQ